MKGNVALASYCEPAVKRMYFHRGERRWKKAMDTEESCSESVYKEVLDLCRWQDKVDLLQKKEATVSSRLLFVCIIVVCFYRAST